MFGLVLGVAISAVVAWLGYNQARRFVTTKLRYVDAMNSPLVPVMAGAAAALLAAPVVSLLPLVGAGTAISFGLSVGLGVASGRSDIHKSLPPG